MTLTLYALVFVIAVAIPLFFEIVVRGVMHDA